MQLQFTDTDFYLEQQAADRQWGLASSLAIGVHVIVVLMVLFMPTIFVSKPIMEEVVSVSLVSMPETTAQSAPPAAAASAGKPAAAEKKAEMAPPPPPPPPPPKPAPPPEPVAAPPEPVAPPPKPQVSVDSASAPPEPIEATNPVSIFPDKRKIKKAQDVRLEEDKVKEREVQERQAEEKELKKKIDERRQQAQQRLQEEKELEKKIEERRREADQKDKSRREAERQKILAQAKIDQIRAENEARQAAAEARQLEGEAKAARDAVASARTEATRQTQAMQSALTQTSSGRQQAQSLVEKQYEAAVASRVKSFWILPEMKSWDSSLLAQVVVIINKEGEVMSIQFDQRSKDPHFDQLVEKTIRSAAPMPRFPAVMQQETIEIGLKFRPGELGNM